MFQFDPALLPFCTDRQRELLETWDRLGSIAEAARALGCHNAYAARGGIAARL